MANLERLKKQLDRVEKQLDKCRTSTMQDGWQTQRFAKKSRKWDYYAQAKIRLLGLIEDEENSFPCCRCGENKAKQHELCSDCKK